MAKWLKQLLLGSFIGLFGVLVYLLPLGLALEEKFGLNWLFHLRGVVTSPDDVIVVAIDQPSATQLDLPITPRLWPRDLHASLIDKLTEVGARVIIFDLIFDTPSVIPENDKKLAHAIKAAGNVVLIERLVYRDTGLLIDDEQTQNRLFEEGPAPLLPIIADAAEARAPFPLPKAERVNDYWTFKASAGDIPTAPVIVLQIFTLPIYDDFVRLLQAADPTITEQLPSHAKDGDIEDLILTLRHIFINRPQITQKIQAELNRDSNMNLTEKKMVTSLLNLYSGHEKNYLNFYGPPRSITTVPYYQVSKLHENKIAKNLPEGIDFKDKVVFVGFSGATQPEQDIVRDDYHTVFSNPDGLFISGVEIAATAFANLLENKPIRPLPLSGALGILFLLGFVMGIVFLILSTRESIVLGIFVISIYTFCAYYLFKEAAIWSPVMIPLSQILFAFILAEIQKHHLEKKKSKQLEIQLAEIRKSLGSSYPNRTVERILGNKDEQGICSPCLTTDVAGYTTLSELMDSRDLGQLINEYRDVLKNPIRQHDGHIMDMIADSMLAIWIDDPENASLRTKACQASLDLAAAVERFNQSQSDSRLLLPTRIGLHFGEMSLRRGDGSYNVIGDVVNTANRIQGANKVLKTRILLSSEVADGLDGFLTRSLGDFILPGKTIPVKLLELVAYRQSASEEQLWLCEIFMRALNAYQLQRWIEASQGFYDILKVFPTDGPTQFFLSLCLRYMDEPPTSPWPTSRIDSK
ncbi:adenylate/guanylate cyclase domain-containing protein [Nitrosomonas sp.]|uniref:CHASE2 domain-containing protein n=1 Tax=Nitrosomonas sp. TaxID=42353 RepID=UPI0025DD7099|nr:adenylate/guanylate cyclase domain-containing protein [Nitrosomonas sp.]